MFTFPLVCTYLPRSEVFGEVFMDILHDDWLKGTAHICAIGASRNCLSNANLQLISSHDRETLCTALLLHDINRIL